MGGGPAGMMAALRAREQGARVLLCEKNALPGRKLLITGKGRCNVTNRTTPDQVLKHIIGTPRFLFSALNRFTPEDTMAFFEEQGVALKVERGDRVFPLSDKAMDIVDAMRKALKRAGVQSVRARAEKVALEQGRVVGVVTDQGLFSAPCVVLATGGLSYPATGSTGDGHEMARACGHTVTPLFPSLVGLFCKDPLCGACAGLTLKNVAIRLYGDGEVCYTDFGEMLFTHTGVSGPVILSASAHMREKKRYTLEVDLKPALDAQTLDKRLLRDFEIYRAKQMKNGLDDLLPASLRQPFLEKTGIPTEMPIHALTKVQRTAMGTLLKALPLGEVQLGPMAEAIVTGGGVKLEEISPKTMESRSVPGLYFAGELLDADGVTGGFNLQIAFATGHAAGLAAGLAGLAGKDEEEQA